MLSCRCIKPAAVIGSNDQPLSPGCPLITCTCAFASRFLQRYYIPSARELQRIESITRSPIYSKFSEALAGVATIRAYRREDYFTAASDELMELNAYAFVTQRAAAAWLAMRLDFMGLVILTCAGGA
jgi:ABC-type multidrug transport system fused ATPase/permease subunit